MAEQDGGRLRPGSQRLATYLGIAGTILGLVGTGAGTWSQYERTRQQGEIDRLNAEVVRLNAEREDRKLDYDIALKVYDKITSIKEQDARQLRLAVALIQVLPDTDFKGRVASVLSALSSDLATASSDPEFKFDASQVAKTATFISQSAQVQRVPDLPKTPDLPLARPAGTTSESASTGVAGGWDYDVFWCEDGVSRAAAVTSNGTAASPAVGAYEKAAEAVAHKLDQPGAGRVRVRMLPDIVNARSGYQIAGRVIRADPRAAEEAQAKAIKALIDEPGAEFRIERTDGATPWYISIFLCSDKLR